MLEKMIGIELEFLLFKNGELIVPPDRFERDGFPILGEIRAKPGKNTVDVLTELSKAQIRIKEKLSKNQSILYTDSYKVPLKLYKEANKKIDYNAKAKEENIIENIYGTNIEDFSDQIVKGGKIQGIMASCGLHIHFSCAEVKRKRVSVPRYKPVYLPIQTALGINGDGTANYSTSNIILYKDCGYIEDKEIVARADRLNTPTINYIVSEMDKNLFEKYAPSEKERTKYRQKGFYRIRKHGFEYRSLPANEKTLNEIDEIVKFAFKLLDSV